MLFFTVTSCVISTSTWKRHFGDKSGPQLNMHPVSKRWICVVGTEDCLVLKNHLHWRRKGNMLRCLAFRWLGESQTFYKKSGVCVCTWSEFTPLKQEVQPQQDMDMLPQFSQSVVLYCIYYAFIRSIQGKCPKDIELVVYRNNTGIELR